MEVRRMTEGDVPKVAFSDPELSEGELRELLEIQGAVGWILNWSFVVGIEVLGEYFVKRWGFDSDKERDELLDVASMHFRRLRVTLSLRRDDHPTILLLTERRWEAFAVAGVQIEMRSPARTSWHPPSEED